MDSYTDQDDDGSEAEADEGLQEAPGDQNRLWLPQTLVERNMMEIYLSGFLVNNLKDIL